jgi:hypothetical protein
VEIDEERVHIRERLATVESGLLGDRTLDSSSAYVQAKWLAEDAIVQAAQSGISADIIRPPRITPHSELGTISPKDFVTDVLLSSIECRMVPMDPTIDLWSPVDDVARMVIESHRRPIFNVRPRVVALGDVFAEIGEHLGLPQVPIEEWLDRVAALGPTTPAAWISVPSPGAEANHSRRIDIESDGVSRSLEIYQPSAKWSELVAASCLDLHRAHSHT